MTSQNWLIIGILVVSLILFIREKPRVDVVALLVLVACVVFGLVDPLQAFVGFSDPAVITVWTVFIISGGITRTGVAEQIGAFISRLAGNDPWRILLVMMIITAVMSSVMNNIGAVAIMLPAIMGICRQHQIAPSKMLMPLSVAALLGGNITLIGTPPNLIAIASMQQAGLEPFSFFAYAPTGLLVTAVGLLYMLFIGYRLLPERTSGEEISEGYDLSADMLTEVVLKEDSQLINTSVNKVRFGLENDVAIVYVRRGDKFIQQSSGRVLMAQDVLLIEGPHEQVIKLSEKLGLQPRTALKQLAVAKKLEAAGELVEITLSPRSRFRGLTLRDIGFRSRYGLTVLGIRHEGEPLVSNVVDVPLRFGDVLLTQGASEYFDGLKVNPNFIVLDNEPQKRGLRRDKAPYAVGILLLTIVAIIFVPSNAVSVTMLIGAIAIVLTGVLTMEEAYDAIDWKSIFLIAGMLPLGDAMNNTGTAELIAGGVISAVGGWGPLIVLGTVFILTALLTSVISNAAATVLIIPISINAARQLGVNPEPFIMTTVIAASSAFLLPIGHQANIIIYGLGGYRFSDFLKVGSWLTLLLLIIIMIFVPIIWPF
ncbi:MAG: di/tricarboxylate transporter [Cellvibrionaceae bacterium]|jgi:di/tricarboxylate transporter